MGPAPIRVLGIDPGSRITGFGIVEKNGSGLRHVENGCLKVSPTAPLPQRLRQIFHEVTKILERFSPNAVAIEEVFFSKNVLSTLKLGESRGVALLAAVEKDLPVYGYSAREVKQAITGYGSASKEQIQKMIARLLKLKEVAQEDASDALAVAICHLHTNLKLLPT